MEDVLQDQLSARDHLFVEHCSSLLVFRPLIDGRPFSDGVTAEVRHWAQLAQVYTDRRIAFVHFTEDVVTFAERVKREAGEDRWKLRARALESFRGVVAAKLVNVSPEIAAQMVDLAASKRQGANMLDEGPRIDKQQKIRDKLPEIEAAAEKMWLESYLQLELAEPRIPRSQVMVWTIDAESLAGELPGIGSFPRG
jgi:hypothetical protein